MPTLAPLPAGRLVEDELASLIAVFFACVTFRPGGVPAYDRLHDLFVPGGLLIRTSGGEPDVCDVREFTHERGALVALGQLTEFEERELSAQTQAWGNVAHRLSTYAKRGVQDGVAFSGQGVITTQFAATGAGWRITAMAWDDERPGLALPA